MAEVDRFLGASGGPSEIGFPSHLNIWFDGNDGTRGAILGNSETTWDAGSSVRVEALHIRWSYGGLYPGVGAAGAFQIWGSETGLTGPWTSVLVDGDPAGTAGASYPGDFDTRYDLADPVTFRYWRFRSTTTNNNDIFTIEGIGQTTVIVGELPEYVEPAPAEALLEIWTSEPGAAEWGSAQWGVDVWGDAGWQDITDIGVSVDIRWGTTNPDAGILADQAAADWSVELFDPDRKVDPANPDSPYYPDIVPGLPIRLSHRGVVVHTGQAETILRRYSEGMATIRASDNIAMMNRAKVPEDVTLADTMKARAREAIAAGGLDIATPSNPNDYAIPAQVPGDRSVWYWVSEAARDRLVIPYIDRDNALRWRAYSVPLRRGRVISDPELVDLQVRADDADRLSVVACLDEDGVTVEERALTPTPRWGKRRYSRDIPTTDADSWAAAVLADRAQSALRWQPGEIRPLTADAVESLATLEVNEEIRLESTTSGAAFYARVLGGRIRVTHDGTAPRWAFRLELTQSQSIYLVSDQDGSPLVSDTDTDEYLEAG